MSRDETAARSRRAGSPGRCSGAPLASVPTLDELAADPARVRDLPPECVAVLHSKCLLALNALWGRQLDLHTTRAAPTQTDDPDTLLTITQAAERLQQTTHWLYRHAHALPFTVRVGRHLRFSSQGIARFIRERAGLP